MEEGRLIWNSHVVLRDQVAALNFTASLLLLPVCHPSEYSMYYLVLGLHDLLQPDLSLANEW